MAGASKTNQPVLRDPVTVDETKSRIEATPNEFPKPTPEAVPELEPMGSPSPAPASRLAPAKNIPAPSTPISAPTQMPAATGQPDQGAPEVDPVTYRQIVNSELGIDDKNFENDLWNGHIEPMTYKSYFAKKDTLGKIGTIFGLLIGGAGAGLSHQPNALLEMMNREIANDLDAQKQSKANAQNFLRTYEQAGAQNSMTRAHNAAVRSAFHNLVIQGQKMPPNTPQRQAWDQALSLLYPQIEALIVDKNDQAAGMAAYLKLYGAPQEGGAPSASKGTSGYGVGQHINLNKMNDMVVRGQALAEQGRPIPPNIGIHPSAAKEVRDQIDDLNQNRALAERYTQAFQELNSMNRAEKFAGAKFESGPWKNKRNALLQMLNTELARMVARRYITQEAADQAAAIAPAWDDTEDSVNTKFHSTMKIFSDVERGMSLLQSHGLYTQFPNYDYKKAEKGKGKTQAPAAKPKTKEGATGKDKQGRPVIYRNGQWILK